MRLITLLTALLVGVYIVSAEDATDQPNNFIANILGAFHGTNTMNLTHFLSSFDMPRCLRTCLADLGNVGSLLDKDSKSMKKMCKQLMHSTQCATVAGCSSTFMDAATNAFQFMCVENMDKVSEHFACIQESSADLQQDCENECAVQSDVIDKASKNNADQLFSMENMCKSTSCLANCYRDNIQKRCDIGEENILDTVLAKFGNGEKTGFEQVLGWVMPEGCKDENLKIKVPKKIALDPLKPKNVGSSASSAISSSAKSKLNQLDMANKSNDTEPQIVAMENNTKSMETSLLVDGQVRTLQCQMFDGRHNPMETPDFESLTKIMAAQFPQQNISSNSTEKPVEKENTKEDNENKRETRTADKSKISPCFGLAPVFTILLARLL